MRIQRLSYLLLLAGALQWLPSCKKSFLEVDPKGIDLESNYYSNAAEAFSGVVAAYDPLGQEAGGTDNTYINKLGPLNAASDECYAGGGSSSDMSGWQAWNKYTLSAAVGPQAGYWDRNYTGIYRVNIILSKLGNVPGLDTATKARYMAEVKFLRAYYYFDLVRLFRNVPLITQPLSTDQVYQQVQAKPEEVYAQIEKDLKEAIPALPLTVPASENGRVTKGAANALMGKVIITQNNTARMLEAAGYLEQVNASGVYSLLPNFGDIFSPANKFNKESIFEIVHTGSQNAGWGNWPNFEGNVYVQMIGPRGYSGPLYQPGYGFNPLITDFVNSMKGDPRYPYTVANIDSIRLAGKGTYDYNSSYQNTGYYIQKYAPLQAYASKTGTVDLNYPNDYIEIRLADTYLLEAEALVRGGGDAAKAQSYLDKVRARVGLPPVPATLDNIYNERKMELATEGHRWFDLVRTGKAATVLAFKGFKAGVNEVLPIPLVELNGTKMIQNSGY